MIDPHQLLQRLADGRFHSGERLAEHFQVTRAAIWKQLRRLPDETGMPVQAVRGRGYRLARPVELLEEQRLQNLLPEHAANGIDRLWVLPVVDSTNAFLARQMPPPAGRGSICIAEYQQAGKGRRGRRWTSGFASGITLSLAWRFDLPLSSLSGLSLVAGVAVAETLELLGLRRHRLKWPNDLIVDGRKLAGILVDVYGEMQGPALAVIGLGLNVRMALEQAEDIDQPWIDLEGVGFGNVSRNDLAATLAERLVLACREFASEGLSAFLPRWTGYDGLRDRTVRVSTGRDEIIGRYIGVDSNGALLLEAGGRRAAFHGGEVTVRQDQSGV